MQTPRRHGRNPSPPFRGEREGPIPGASSMRRPDRRELCSRREGRWEGEVGIGERSGIPHLTPALSAPNGGEGDRREPGTAVPFPASLRLLIGVLISAITSLISA